MGIHGGSHAIDFAAVLTAVATAGIVFSFNGFQSPVNLAGEAHDPGKSIPFAVVGSIVLATLIYVLLQVAYLGAVPPDLLAKAGWHAFGRQMRAWWLVVYLPTIAALSWAGSTTFGGRGYLPYGWDLAVVALVGLLFYGWGVKSGWRTPSVEAAEIAATKEAGRPLVPPDEQTAKQLTGR